MGAHKQAKDVVERHLLGTSIVEVSRKTPWGFHKDFELENYCVDDFLSRPYQFVHTTILHILCGEGEPSERVVQVLDKALKQSMRVLVLEHNPKSTDWKGSRVGQESIDVLETVLGEGHFQYHKETIGDNERNILYVVSTVPYLDMNSVNNCNLREVMDYTFVSEKQGKGARDYTGRIFAMSSEDMRNPNRLFDDDIVQAFKVHGESPSYFIIGGLMFLDALRQVNPSCIRLFDCSFHQCVYAAFVVNAILRYKNLTTFHVKFLLSGEMSKSDQDKISFLWGSYDKFCKTLAQSLRHSSQIDINDDGSPRYKWRNLLYIGAWRRRFRRVQERLEKHLDWIRCMRVSELEPESGAIVYLSTLRLEHFDHMQDQVLVYAREPRNTPRLENRHSIGSICVEEEGSQELTIPPTSGGV